MYLQIVKYHLRRRRRSRSRDLDRDLDRDLEYDRDIDLSSRRDFRSRDRDLLDLL